MGDARGTDPLVSFNFRLEVHGETEIIGYFTEVAGIGSEHDVIEHKVVDDKGKELVQMIPGRLKWTQVTLKRGITADAKFWDWRQKVVDGSTEKARSNCAVVMMDRNYNDVARWEFVRAWPSKISGPSIKSDSNEFGVEELTMVHEGMIRVK